MKLGFFTDPHLGLNRTANTTPDSRKRLTRHMYHMADKALKLLSANGANRVFCLGDLLDKHSNNESVIRDAVDIAKQCTLVLAGNHDVMNRVDSMGTLQLIKALRLGEVCVAPDPAEPYFYRHRLSDFGSVGVVDFVPHALTQDLFEDSLDHMLEHPPQGKNRLCCLHCNVGETGVCRAEDEGTTLYLTEAYQEKLLAVYDYILVGHEHVPATAHDGRIIILGNTYPVGFGELADRYVYVFDTDTGVMEKHALADMAAEVATIGAYELMADVSSEPMYSDAVHLVDVTGRITYDDAGKLAKAMRTFWQSHPNLLMVRNSVQIEKAAAAQRDESSEWAPKTLPELVEQSVEATPYREAYREAAQAVREATPK